VLRYIHVLFQFLRCNLLLRAGSAKLPVKQQSPRWRSHDAPGNSQEAAGAGAAARMFARPRQTVLMTNTLETGGSERQFVTVARELSGGGWNAYCGCLKRVGPFIEEMPDIAEFDLGGSFYNLRAQFARVELARHLRRKRYGLRTLSISIRTSC